MEPRFDFQHFLLRKKLKQREAAEMLGVSLGLVGAWASGKAKPSYETLVKLIENGASAEEIFGNDVSKKLLDNSNADQITKPSTEELKASIREVMKDMLGGSNP